ncbi:HRQ family protein [Cordyceps javanica]|uniref:HRQ family protein n=1 Tax=Cordyceps javanica TaxID=43265 RepID=A0A545USS9_9HYPO|nr:HRQ family protein [Cordyceps javanica]
MPANHDYGILYATISCVVGACIVYALATGRNVWPGAGALRRRQRSPNQSDTDRRRQYDFSKNFPPSQRGSSMNSSLALWNVGTQSSRLLPMDADYRLANPSLYVFSGFTVGEIKSLGKFPDYAKLSGVPLPTPLERFSIDSAEPRPYRPFRWPYVQTMSLQKMDPDYWIELESTYSERIFQRHELFAAHGKNILCSLPGSELACNELMEMVVQFLCARYPQLFKRNGMTLMNHILGTTSDLTSEEPLRVLLKNVPEDFAIMLRDERTGRYCLRAGVVCSTIGWTLGEKIGLGLADIHQPVPDYHEKIGLSTDRYAAQAPSNATENDNY